MTAANRRLRGRGCPWAERSSITTMILTVLLSVASRPEGKETTITMGFVRANRRHAEHHAVERLGWLRAAVLGANDGILSYREPLLWASPPLRGRMRASSSPAYPG
jgi:hypothetical protein